MNAPPDDDDVIHLLPWYVNGTLEPELQDRVARHLAHSPRCRAEELWLQQLRAELKGAAPTRSRDAGLDKLTALIRAQRMGKLVTLNEALNRRR
jgi:anti-sigma factor RsiW